MPRRRTYKFRELCRILKKYDDRFEIVTNRGKGSERMIYHPDIDGRPEQYPLKCHGGGTEIRAGTISAIRRRFALPSDVL